jgi:hypothetical protein
MSWTNTAGPMIAVAVNPTRPSPSPKRTGAADTPVWRESDRLVVRGLAASVRHLAVP